MPFVTMNFADEVTGVSFSICDIYQDFWDKDGNPVPITAITTSSHTVVSGGSHGVLEVEGAADAAAGSFDYTDSDAMQVSIAAPLPRST